MQRIKKNDKILCVCEGGNSRSVALAWLFKKHVGLDAMAIGLRDNTPETFDMMAKWADHIIVTDKKLETRVPKKWSSKLRTYDVGPDRYFRGFRDSLIEQFMQHLKEDNADNL